MSRTARTTWHDPHEIVRQVRVGTLTRRNLLRLFGVSAASLGLASVTGACSAPLRYDYVIVGAGSTFGGGGRLAALSWENSAGGGAAYRRLQVLRASQLPVTSEHASPGEAASPKEVPLSMG